MITVIGDALLDVARRSRRAPLRAGGDVPAEIRLEPGGQGANVAVRLARLGHRVRLACAIGTDAAGDLLRDRAGGGRRRVVELTAPATGAVVVLLDGRRERTMLSQRVPLTPGIASSPHRRTAGSSSRGTSCSSPMPASRAPGSRHDGCCSGALSTAADAIGWAARARSLAPHLVVLNADEARVIGAREGTAAELALEVADRLGAIVVVTHPAGATAALDGGTLGVGARSSGPIVDTTGAGDAFSAGLIAALAGEPWPPSSDRLDQAMASAMSLAAAVARVPGAQTRVDEEPA